MPPAPTGYKERNVGDLAPRRRRRGSVGRAMGVEATAPVTTPPPSSFRHTNPSSSSSSVRFLGLLKQPDSDSSSNPSPNLELDESDVVWSASEPSSASSSPTSAGSASYSPSDRYRHQQPETRPFVPERSGLSAALAEDSLLMVRQRRPAAARGRVPMPAGRAGAEEAGVGMGKGFHQSAPVNVPAWPSWRRGMRLEAMEDVEDGEEEREEEEEEEEMVPPHVIVARSHVMTFSVFEGVGRTLKGRDLRRVRNAVLEKTGFL